jgi:putative oxidoreductase
MPIRILSWALGLLFIAAGLPKIVGVARFAERFDQFGYSPAFRVSVGVVEVAGGAGLLIPASALYAAAVLIVDMLGAIWTTRRVHESGAPPLAVGALLVILVILRVRTRQRRILSAR